MKRFIIGVLGIILLLGLGRGLMNKLKTPNSNSNLNQYVIQIIKSTPTPTNYALRTTNSRSLFIPYWSTSLTEYDMKYDNYYYFGIAPTATGEIKNDVGLSSMPKVVESLKQKAESQKKVVLRMLDSGINEALLASEAAQDTLVREIITILEQNNFSGILLDLEVPFSLNSKKQEQITKFVQQICTGVKANYKTCDVLVYGDTLYRGRPYDLRELSQAADKIILMAYDFHKAGGEPGPNFPLARQSESGGGPSTIDYGYSFKQMVSDVTTLVPKQKLEVVFGMYGYDWTLNEQGKPLKSAEALSVNEIQLKAKSLKLKVQSNPSKEKSIQYTDSEGRSHIIWYEDEESVAVKREYLRHHGVSQVTFWAHSYF